jgi:hypothetical protein
MNTTCAFRIEQRRRELAAKAAGLSYLMYSPPSYPHRSGLLYRSCPTARLSLWNPLEDDGDLLRLAIAVSGVDLHSIIVEARSAGGSDVGRRVGEAFVDAVIGPLGAEDVIKNKASPEGAVGG